MCNNAEEHSYTAYQSQKCGFIKLKDSKIEKCEDNYGNKT
jgi:hypothetical protein